MHGTILFLCTPSVILCGIGANAAEYGSIEQGCGQHSDDALPLLQASSFTKADLRKRVESSVESPFDLDEIELMRSDFKARGMNFKIETLRKENGLASLSSAHRKRAIHLHVHNAAGTYMCHIAHKNGEIATAHMEGNCNCRFEHDDPWYGPAHRNYTCADREEQMGKMNGSTSFGPNGTETQGLTFAMIEREIDFDSGDWCPSMFIYTIIMRDPVKRAVTTLRLNEHGNLSRVYEHFQRGLHGETLDSEQSWLHSWAAYSDLYVRVLNGPDVMKLPLGHLNTSHLQFAKERLAEFHAVLAVPTLLTDYVQLVDVLGWSPSLAMETHGSKMNNITDATMDTLLETHNYWDKQLYEYGVALARNRSDALILPSTTTFPPLEAPFSQ